MMGAETTNNISIDQAAARVLGQQTRYPSLVLGTEGGTGSYGILKRFLIMDLDDRYRL